MRPIDADALYDALWDNEFQTFCPLDEVDSVIAAAPTLDYAPVRHGEWIPLEETQWNCFGLIIIGYRCSVCGREEPHNNEPYCHCGALMDGKDCGNET